MRLGIAFRWFPFHRGTWMITDDYRGRRCFLCVAPFILAPFLPLPAGNTGEFVPTFPYCRCRLDRGRKTMTAPLEKNREPWIFPFSYPPPRILLLEILSSSLLFYIFHGLLVRDFSPKKREKERKNQVIFLFKGNHRSYSRIWIRSSFDLSTRPSIHFRSLKSVKGESIISSRK